MTAAGWYADPWRQAPYRWWDGAQWMTSTWAGPMPPEPRQSRAAWWGWSAGALLVGLIVLGIFTDDQQTRRRSTVSDSRTISYSVGGTANRASLTIENQSGGTEQKTVSVPWSDSFTMEPGEFVYLSAQNEGKYGSLTCSITSDGRSVQSARSDGAYVIASCSGSS